MAKGREKSDGRIVPQGRRKAAPTARTERGGKAATASEQVGQLRLFRGTADSPQGAGGDGGVGVPAPKRRSVPKPRTTTGPLPPTMTMLATLAGRRPGTAYAASGIAAGRKAVAGIPSARTSEAHKRPAWERPLEPRHPEEPYVRPTSTVL